MKNIIYILLIFCFISCKNNEAIKSESADIEVDSDYFEEEIISGNTSLEKMGAQKLIEYLDLIKLKQKHPEFETDINAQLLSFTNDSLNFNYPEEFIVSDIKQIGEIKKSSDSLKTFTLGFIVTTKSGSFKDSLVTEIKSKEVYIDNVKKISQKVRFLKIE